RVFAHDDQVYIRIARGNVGQIANGTEVGVELEFLAQRDVDAGKTAANRSAYRPLESNMRALDGFCQFLGNVFFIFLEGLGPSHEGFPFKLDPRGFEDAHGRLRYFGADAIAGDESDLVCHVFTLRSNVSTTRSTLRCRLAANLRLFRLEQVFQLSHEFLYILEVEIHRREADVSHFVIAAQTIHDQLAKFAGFALALRRFDY